MLYFSVIFVIIIIKITIITILIIIATVIIIISIFICHTRKTLFLTSEKKRTKLLELEGTGVNVLFLLMASHTNKLAKLGDAIASLLKLSLTY